MDIYEQQELEKRRAQRLQEYTENQEIRDKCTLVGGFETYFAFCEAFDKGLIRPSVKAARNG